jgi:hypothetical protein
MEVAFATVAPATVRQMDEGLNKWRRERLQALADAIGSKAELGRKLGYRDGAFVGQMISGLRPITEKTIQAAEAIRGPTGQSFKGWFSREVAAGAAQAANEPGAIFDAPTPDELELLDNFRHMLDDDRNELAAEIAQRAAKAKANVDAYIKRFGLTPRPASASAKAATAKSSTSTAPSKQRQLELDAPKSRR